MNERIRRTLLRTGAAVLPAALCVAAMLYYFGYFDLSFVDRAPESTRPPDEVALESTLAGLRPGETVGSIGTTAPESTAPSTDPPVTEPPETAPAPSTLADLLAQGYRQTDADWAEGMALVPFDFDAADFEPAQFLEAGERVTFTYEEHRHDEDGEPWVEEVETTATRYGIELYGGYMMVDQGNGMVALAEADGTLVGRYSATDLVPAYTRDKEGRPLWRSTEQVAVGVTETVYAYLDATGALRRSDYNPDTDGRGLNFDYLPTYGRTDSAIAPFVESRTETLVDSIDKTNWYILGAIDPALVTPIEKMDPAYADLVASRNPAFEKALAALRQAQSTATPEPTPVDPNRSPELSAALGILGPVLDEANPRAAMAFPGGIVRTEGNNLIISRTLTRHKWGLVYDTGWRLTGALYLRTYAPREGYAAAVDEEGRLIFLGANGYRALPNHSWANEWIYLTNENSRYVAASYVEPLYPDLRSIGHLYYDRGYVRVRELERDYSYRESITADRELLIDTNGNEFAIPEGYTLAGYSDGVLLLERGGKYGYYSVGGYWIAQPAYTYAQPFMEGLGVIGFDGGRCGVVDTEGRIVVPFAYEYISAPSSGLIAAYDGEAWTLFAKVARE